MSRKGSHPAWLFLFVASFAVVAFSYGRSYARAAPGVREGAELISTGTKTRAQLLFLWPGATGRRGRRMITEKIDYEFQAAAKRVQIQQRPVPIGTRGFVSVGQKIDVWYDPNNPDRCRTQYEQDYWEQNASGHFRSSAFFAALAVVVAALMSLYFVQWRRRNTAAKVR